MNEILTEITSDGSHTLFVPALNEHYHSKHGAVQESQLVFIANGLNHVPDCQKEINLLEIGFGTGLNALIAALEALKEKKIITYVGIEPYPVANELIAGLNYATVLGGTEATGYYQKLHQAGWSYPVYLSDYFILSKLQAKLEDIALREEQFHLIFFDAFSPETQPELWTDEVFEKMYACLKPFGILVTYCCKGTVKRALTKAGFTVEKLPGPPGKREVLRAVKMKP